MCKMTQKQWVNRVTELSSQNLAVLGIVITTLLFFPIKLSLQKLLVLCHQKSLYFSHLCFQILSNFSLSRFEEGIWKWTNVTNHKIGYLNIFHVHVKKKNTKTRP